MEPANKPNEQSEKKNFISAAPPVEPYRPSRFKGWLNRTCSAFTAEYSIFLIMLGVSLSNLAWLVYILFGLVVYTVNGGAMASFVPANMLVLWLGVSSLVAMPLTYVLWRRVQGELAANQDYKGELPKGAAKGFRTFWMILNLLGMIGLVIAAVYAPLAAAVGGGFSPQLLLSVTVPALINAVVSGAGLYLVTRSADRRKGPSIVLAIIVVLTAGLFIADYLWSSNIKTTAPSYTSPSYTSPSDTYDPYSNVYDDSYYDYSTPSTYR